MDGSNQPTNLNCTHAQNNREMDSVADGIGSDGSIVVHYHIKSRRHPRNSRLDYVAHDLFIQRIRLHYFNVQK